LEDQRGATNQQTAMHCQDFPWFSLAQPAKGKTNFYFFSFTKMRRWKTVLAIKSSRFLVKTCLETANDLSPRSANLSITAKAFLLKSSLQLQRVKICLQKLIG
jgi:hypothetical protein